MNTIEARRLGCVLAMLMGLAGLGSYQPAAAHEDKSSVAARLPVIGPAPPFVLTAQSGQPVSLRDFAGKVVAINFIYTRCTDTCPTVTAKMALLQNALGPDFGARVHFVSITVEPEVDTPAVLAAYARGHGADSAGWSFVTGAPQDIAAVVQRYGGIARRIGPGNVDHLLLTSLIDRHGRLRVQYLGHQFRAKEMLADLQMLVRE